MKVLYFETDDNFVKFVYPIVDENIKVKIIIDELNKHLQSKYYNEKQVEIIDILSDDNYSLIALYDYSIKYILHDNKSNKFKLIVSTTNTTIKKRKQSIQTEEKIKKKTKKYK